MKKNKLAWVACAGFALATSLSNASAQGMSPSVVIFSQQQLDQMLAPVALYPDALLAQVLMAATFPVQVVDAARLIDSHPGLQGDAMARAVAPMLWDSSVKSLAQFPSVIAMMNDKLDWTQSLGEAFLAQQNNVMDTVQTLRMKAQSAGTLASNGQQRIVQQDRIIVIEPVNPQVLYVPYYNPVVVYGNWWWPQQPPVYWVPPPRYQPPSYNMSINVGIAFGVSVGIVGSVYSNARPDWREHQVLVNNVYVNNVTNNINQHITINNQAVAWQRGGSHRGAPHPDLVNTVQAPAHPAYQAIAAIPPPYRPVPQAAAQPAPHPQAVPQQSPHPQTVPQTAPHPESALHAVPHTQAIPQSAPHAEHHPQAPVQSQQAHQHAEEAAQRSTEHVATTAPKPEHAPTKPAQHELAHPATKPEAHGQHPHKPEEK